MRIVFIHYHLKPGGVTTVLRQQVRAVRNDCEALVITGETPAAGFEPDIVTIPGIAYDGTSPCRDAPEKIAGSIQAAIQSRWKSGCDLIHVHNPLLKKNRRFLSILDSLQRRGFRLFLQIHDFAEDGRPSAYFQEPYPADCHYGVINSRDYRILLDAGLKPQGLHRLPNAVSPISAGNPSGRSAPLAVYPIRGIRRKNLGEALLVSLFFPKGVRLGITLPPNSPADRAAYADWQRFSARHHLPVDFDLGLRHDFSKIVAQSLFLMTTSIGEGFGFSFLEPWTAGKPLWGRDLPDITQDFKDIGLRLDHLYSRLRVPLSNDRKERLAKTWKSCVARNCALLGVSLQPADIHEAFARMTGDNTVDFGLLNEPIQQEILETVMKSRQYRTDLLDLNPFLVHPGGMPQTPNRVDHNRRLIQQRFSLSVYQETLMQTYAAVCRQKVRHGIDKRVLLESFFNLDRLSLLKWGA